MFPFLFCQIVCQCSISSCGLQAFVISSHLWLWILAQSGCPDWSHTYSATFVWKNRFGFCSFDESAFEGLFMSIQLQQSLLLQTNYTSTGQVNVLAHWSHIWRHFNDKPWALVFKLADRWINGWKWPSGPANRMYSTERYRVQRHKLAERRSHTLNADHARAQRHIPQL